ncbi:Rieske (2Fe-2S) protein [Nocardia arizonensis]|uniref:Rieske (2Fe-2S) protein n=1 Tax=Nocardia arizonensis TaxID=1141647 RepID=UPI0006D1AF02|nr:Rieske (2Fe-2S) protein [Nocardia arizonensis]
MTNEIDRRTVVVGAAGVVAAAAALTACSTYGDNAPAPAPTTGTATPTGSGGQRPAAATEAIAKTADIPVGGGVIVGTMVVTQPTAGVFAGFDSTCPHAGCKVNAVSNGTINCPCHGSKFGLDGAVVAGPAKSPLAPKQIRVEGDSVVGG